MQIKSMSGALLGAVLASGFASAAFAVELAMVEQPGCHYCIKWDEEIAPAYPKTTEGQFAPLKRVQLGQVKDEIDLARRVNYTPTFILIDEGQELARIEGYPGEDFFWPLLAQMLKDKAGYTEGE